MSSDAKWARLSKSTVFSCPYYQLSHDRYRRPDGQVTDYHYVDIPGSTMIVPMLADGRLVLTRQYRYLMRRSSLEFPAGGLRAGVDPLHHARQELREEAGYVARQWDKIGEFAPCKGLSNEICRVYLARSLSAVPAEPEPTEEIEMLTLPAEAVSDRIAAGELWDGMSIASFSLFERWRAANG